MIRFAASLLLAIWLFPASSFAAGLPADRVFRNGTVFTADAHRSIAEAVAIRDGRFVYVGTNEGVANFIGSSTKVTDLKGRFLMPGIVDGHMHPLEAGEKMRNCSLNYESGLTVAEMQREIQACLDKTKTQEPNGWLEVVYWFQEAMRPAGLKTNHAMLDVLKTSRPIIVYSSFGHTALANSRALALAKITKATPDPQGGKIWRDADGNPTGLLEDSAYAVFSDVVPKPTVEENTAAAKAAQEAMIRQGITSFLDADAAPEDAAAFTALKTAGELAVRAHFAPRIHVEDGHDPAGAVAKVVAYKQKYDQGAIKATPGITIRNAKLFLDGVIAVPALTGAMLEPYLMNAGTEEHPRWVPSQNRGPDVYSRPSLWRKFWCGWLRPASILTCTRMETARCMPRSTRSKPCAKTLAGRTFVLQLRTTRSSAPPISRASRRSMRCRCFRSSGKNEPGTGWIANYFGPERMKILEPAGFLAAAGARIVFGSDWPVDPLNEWLAFKVGITRTDVPTAPVEFRSRLGDDPGLSRETVLRAATIDAAYELHEDDVTGSLEAGKFADLIVIDRNPLKIAEDDIANVKVLETVLGGRTVYEATAKR